MRSECVGSFVKLDVRSSRSSQPTPTPTHTPIHSLWLCSVCLVCLVVCLFIQGTVTKVDSVKPKTVVAAYVCQSCGAESCQVVSGGRAGGVHADQEHALPPSLSLRHCVCVCVGLGGSAVHAGDQVRDGEVPQGQEEPRADGPRPPVGTHTPPPPNPTHTHALCVCRLNVCVSVSRSFRRFSRSVCRSPPGRCPRATCRGP